MKITIEIPRSAAIDLLRQLEAQLRPEQPPLKVVVNIREELLARRATDFPWPETPIHRSRVCGYSNPLGPMTVEDLCRMKEKDSLKMKNWGAKTLHYVKESLAAEGLKFGMTNEEIEAYRGT